MAERGFFVQEMNGGWKEWSDAGHPTHAAALAAGAIACECSLGAESLRSRATT